MQLQDLPIKLDWPTSKDPLVWERLLDSLPEGTELIVDEHGQVTGVVIQLVCMLDDDKESGEYDKMVNA